MFDHYSNHSWTHSLWNNRVRDVLIILIVKSVMLSYSTRFIHRKFFSTSLFISILSGRSKFPNVMFAVCIFRVYDGGNKPLVLTWINFVPAWISNHMPSRVWVNYISIPNFNGATVEVWEWISNFIPHFIMDDPFWDLSWAMLGKWTTGRSGEIECNVLSQKLYRTCHERARHESTWGNNP